MIAQQLRATLTTARNSHPKNLMICLMMAAINLRLPVARMSGLLRRATLTLGGNPQEFAATLSSKAMVGWVVVNGGCTHREVGRDGDRGIWWSSFPAPFSLNHSTLEGGLGRVDA